MAAAETLGRGRSENTARVNSICPVPQSPVKCGGGVRVLNCEPGMVPTTVSYIMYISAPNFVVAWLCREEKSPSPSEEATSQSPQRRILPRVGLDGPSD